MEKPVMYFSFVLLWVQSWHVQAQSSGCTTPSTDSSEAILLGLYIVVGGIMAVRIVFLIVMKCLMLAKDSRLEKKLSPCQKSMWVDLEMGVQPQQLGGGVWTYSDKPIMYSPQEVREATQNFSPVCHVGGSVYRGTIHGRDVAIKRMKGDVSKEVKSLQKVEHENLVKLEGFCITPEGKAYLIYEYVENGSLNLWLHNKENRRLPGMMNLGFEGLTWRSRLQIALDVATGLKHIHEHAKQGIAHGDLKSSNVLLNNKLRAKIANFWSARSGVNAATKHVEGREGCMAPEYSIHGALSPKIDVFAFGVMLLELISGKKVIMKDERGATRLLWTQIRTLLESEDREEKLRKWIDPNVQDTYSIDSAVGVALLARACLEKDVEARPTMREIVSKLSDLLDVCFEHLEC